MRSLANQAGDASKQDNLPIHHTISAFSFGIFALKERRVGWSGRSSVQLRLDADERKVRTP